MTTSPSVSASETGSNSAPVPASEQQALLASARRVLDVEIEALEDLKSRLGDAFFQAVQLIEACQGRVIVTGMGKSGHVGRKIAATMASTGTPAFFLHPAEGSHGDLGMLTEQDTVIAISNSGETPEILSILPLIKRFGLPLIAITALDESTLAKQSDVVLNIAVKQEACPLNLAPTASTTATLALGDTLAVVLLERKGFTPDDFALFHPAGALGKRLLLTVKDLMHTGDALPVVDISTSFLDALLMISDKKLGMAVITDKTRDNQLLGILTDGDIRRALTRFGQSASTIQPETIQIEHIMTVNPKTIVPDALAVTALRLMEDHQITALLVADKTGEKNRPEGVIHLHDILKTGIR